KLINAVPLNSLFFIEFSLGQNDGSGVVVATYNISAPQGSQAELQCHSQRMVWTQDRLKDRQRVVHWDLLRSSPDHAMERVIDMFSAFHIATMLFLYSLSEKRYKSCHRGGTFSKARKERRFWDGQKAVFVVLVGGTVALPCVNRRPIWTEGNSQEDQQQVVHWDRQPPGVRHDRADRLIDLYASGERRHYGPLFVQQKMNISATAFSQGDFSLTISDIQPLDQGLYSCHLHHHYCGLHERRIFQLTVMPPVPQITQEPTDEPQYLPNEEPNTNMVEVPPHVINVILPEQRNHFLQQLGYILAILLLLALVVLAIILLTCHRKRQDFDPRKVEILTDVKTGHTSCVKKECERSITDVKSSNQEETKLDYKNNLLKEAEMSKLCSPKAIDLDREMEKPSWK
uniref:Matrix remodeling-associated protein 8 n=1 Tax=Cyprinus carpio TaxID=7962 RepID=A0A8C2D702_CYPCA